MRNPDPRFFNGTRDGHPYHARVTRTAGGHFEVDIVTFHRATGEPFDSFSRVVTDTSRGQRAAVRAVLADPDAF